MEGGEGEKNSLQGKEEGGQTSGGCFSLDVGGAGAVSCSAVCHRLVTGRQARGTGDTPGGWLWCWSRGCWSGVTGMVQTRQRRPTGSSPQSCERSRSRSPLRPVRRPAASRGVEMPSCGSAWRTHGREMCSW